MARQGRDAQGDSARKRRAAARIRALASAPPPSEEGLREQAGLLADVLAQTNLVQRASRAAELAGRAFDRSLAAHPMDMALACKRGCTFCCRRNYVTVSAPEALLIARTVRGWNTAERDAATARIVAADAATRGRSVADRRKSGPDCPFLVAESCSVYESRPLACRAAVSADVKACEDVYNGVNRGIPSPALPLQLKTMYRQALEAACTRLNLWLGNYELNAAARIALETPEAEKRWLAGEDIFAPAAPGAAPAPAIKR